MNKVTYLLTRMCKMDFTSLVKTAKKISKKTNKNYMHVLCDMILCGIKYGAGYVDYDTFGFYDMNKRQRKTVITRGKNNVFVVALNDKKLSHIIDDKVLFDKKYKDFLNREFIDIREGSFEDFLKYLKEKKEIIAKPINLSCGKGIEKIYISDDTDLRKLYDKLKENKQFLIEDCVIQHDDLNKLYPCSVNTLRIVSVNTRKGVKILFRCIRMGNDGNFVDNFNHGGLFTTIDEDGVIRKPAVDKKGNVYERHPYTGTKIVGYKIPMFDEVIDYVKKLAMVIPEVRYTGWDIAVTKDGPTVIEGNPYPGHDLYQSKIHLREGNEGLLPVFNKILE